MHVCWILISSPYYQACFYMLLFRWTWCLSLLREGSGYEEDLLAAAAADCFFVFFGEYDHVKHGSLTWKHLFICTFFATLLTVFMCYVADMSLMSLKTGFGKRWVWRIWFHKSSWCPGCAVVSVSTTVLVSDQQLFKCTEVKLNILDLISLTRKTYG